MASLPTTTLSSKQPEIGAAEGGVIVVVQMPSQGRREGLHLFSP